MVYPGPHHRVANDIAWAPPAIRKVKPLFSINHTNATTGADAAVRRVPLKPLSLRFRGPYAHLETPFRVEYMRASLHHTRLALVLGALF